MPLDAHLPFKTQHNLCMRKAREGEDRLGIPTKMYVVILESIRAVYLPCVHTVTLYGSELWWDRSEVGW